MISMECEIQRKIGRDRKMSKDYTATVRLQKGSTAELPIYIALDIHEAAEVVRAKYGLDTDNPHKGFTVRECYT